MLYQRHLIYQATMFALKKDNGGDKMKIKKPNFIVGKKQVILASITLLLGLAIYVNYSMSGADQIKATKTVNTNSTNYGVANFVSESENSDDYFSKARVDRMTSRDEATETLKNVINGGDTTDEEKAVAAEKASTVSKLIESESKIENLIKAAGYEECVVYLDGERASIVVKSDDLTNAQAAQIKDILLSEVDVASENIKIFAVK